MRVTRLAAVRHYLGVTQQELADAVGVSLDTVRRLELARTPNPPLHTVINCARALGVRLTDVSEPQWLRSWNPPAALPSGGSWPERETRGEMPEWLPPRPEPEPPRPFTDAEVRAILGDTAPPADEP